MAKKLVSKKTCDDCKLLDMCGIFEKYFDFETDFCCEYDGNEQISNFMRSHLPKICGYFTEKGND